MVVSTLLHNAVYSIFYNIITARRRSLGQDNVFTVVCHSFCSDRLPWTETPLMVKSGRYASYWNAFLLRIELMTKINGPINFNGGFQ